MCRCVQIQLVIHHSESTNLERLVRGDVFAHILLNLMKADRVISAICLMMKLSTCIHLTTQIVLSYVLLMMKCKSVNMTEHC